jgi:hypothetical protein
MNVMQAFRVPNPEPRTQNPELRTWNQERTQNPEP